MTDLNEARRLANELDAGENFYAESSMWFDYKLADAVLDAAATIRALVSRVEAAERDAERYRWLRHERLGELLVTFNTSDMCDIGLDAAIDAARGEG